ncbi:MAG: hypothetical protein H0U72_00590 [Nitrosospira sp.]|nr:hypothetical protein [Nitrosospira sp.]
MSQQFQSKSLAKTKHRITRSSSSPTRARTFQGGRPSPILQLQRLLGNQPVAQLIQARRLTPQGRIIGLQPKLTVGAADDPYEQETDRVARQVMTMPDTASNSMQRSAAPEDTPEEKIAEEGQDKVLQTRLLTASITPLAQRQVEEEEETEALQASAAGSLADSFEAGAEVESRLNRSKGGGSPPCRMPCAPSWSRASASGSMPAANKAADAFRMARRLCIGLSSLHMDSIKPGVAPPRIVLVIFAPSGNSY